MTLVFASALAACATAALPTTPRLQRLQSEFERLKNEAHLLDEATMRSRLKALRGEHINVFGGARRPHQSKIEHIVVMLVENHSFDNMLGCMGLPGADGIDPINGHSVPIDPTDPSKGSVTMKCGTADYVCKGGPSYNLFESKFPPGTSLPAKPNSNEFPYAPQDDKYSYARGLSNAVGISAYAPSQIPVKHEVAKEFGVFNKYYCAVPSASTPNHLMIQSATSCGITDNIIYSDCGGPTATFPQFTIYDSLYVNNIDFRIFMNSTCGIDGHPACHGVDPNSPSAGSPIPTPDVAMSGVGRYKKYFESQKVWYDRAANGTLPALSWLLPPIEACDHPCYDIAKGERLLKDTYEALRAGPGWNKTLFFVVYDDAGDYYDHIVPPFEGVPSDDAPCHVVNGDDGLNECSPKFDFRRLGLRTTAFLISPFVAKGSVFQRPKGPMNTSQFEHTSVPATLKNLFNLSGFLTKRDEWAGSFHELLLDAPRADADMPMHLPTPPAAATPWGPIPSGAPTKASRLPPGEPQHCSRAEGVCTGVEYTTVKQQKQIRDLVGLFPVTDSEEEGGVVAPDLETLNRTAADAWIRATWGRWMTLDEGYEEL